MNQKLLFFVSGLALIFTTSVPRLEGAEFPDFQREIRPILSNACYKCHGPDKAERKGGKENSGGLRFDTEEGARAALDDGVAIFAGHPEKSQMVTRIKSKVENTPNTGPISLPFAQPYPMSATQPGHETPSIRLSSPNSKNSTFTPNQKPAD